MFNKEKTEHTILPERPKTSDRSFSSHIHLVFVFVFFLLSSCAPYKSYLLEKSKFHPTRDIAYWSLSWKEKSLVERISAAPAALLEKIRIENKIDGFSEIPSPAEPAPEFFEAIHKINHILPEKVRMLLEERIIGIFIVRDLGGSGYAETVLNEEGREYYAVIVLDRNILLKRTANEWATWKEKSVFKHSDGIKVNLRVAIESPANDTVVNAITYILLHEIGHAIGMVSGVHPSWSNSARVSDAYPFTKLSWIMSGNQAISLFDDNIPQRRSIKPYAFDHSLLSLDEAPDLYKNLYSYSNFPSIHAAVNLWEDFAESFVTYVHVIYEKKPHIAYLTTDGNPDMIYYSCWNRKICESKMKFLNSWFDNPLTRQ
jgi:hypothetical protein